MEATLKYPLLFVHGMGFRDRRYFNYWGRIPDMAEKMGCAIYYGMQDSNGSVKTNGLQLKERTMEILSLSGCEKINIIAHSKGGLDSRFMISSLGMADSVASLTTIATPHHGSGSVDLLHKIPPFFTKRVAVLCDGFYKALGDKSPSSYEIFDLLTTKGAEKFNRENPDSDKVYYQSYAFVMKNPLSDILMLVPWCAVRIIEGENDGLITPRSAEWTNYKGVFKSPSLRGISHCDEIDFRRVGFNLKKEGAFSDILDLYKSIIKNLYEMGF